MDTVFQKTYTFPKANLKEILRYAGVREVSDTWYETAKKCAEECGSVTNFGRICWCTTPVSALHDEVNFPFIKVKSRSLASSLCGCNEAIIFGATVGIAIDRLIEKYMRTEVSKAVLIQAVGSERIEALCDVFCEEMAEEARARQCQITPRFSPGYGDLPLSFQREIFKLLDCSRRIGLSLNESLLMSPSKSVTAIIGIKKYGV